MNPTKTVNTEMSKDLLTMFRKVGGDWVEYLESTGNIGSYDGLCGCYSCNQIRDGYWPWRAKKEESNATNGGHKCIACGKEHAGCCGQCPEYRPLTNTENQ